MAAHFFDTRGDVAAYLAHGEFGTKCEELHLPTQGAGVHDCACGECRKRPAIVGNQAIAHVGAVADGGDVDACGRINGQVFQGVNGKINFAGAKAILEFEGEDALAAECGEGRGKVAVAFGDDGDNFTAQIGKCCVSR